MAWKGASRRGFTVVIVPLILAITLVIIGVVYAVQNQTPIAPNGSKPMSLKIVSLCTVLGGWFVVMASPWAEKKGRKSANIFFGTILLLINLAMLNFVTGWSASMRAKNAGRTGTPMAPPPLASAPIGPPDAGEPNTPTSGSGPVANPPASSQSTVSATRRGSHPNPSPGKPAVDLEPLAGMIKQEVAAELELRAKDGANVYAILEKPRHDRKQIDEQIAALGKAKKDLEGTGNRLRGISEEFRTRAEDLGAGMSESMGRSIDLGREIASFEKIVACDAIGRAAETGKELLVVLRDNIAKWTYNTKGEITTKDKQLDHQLFGPKAQVGFALSDKSKNLEALKAK